MERRSVVRHAGEGRVVTLAGHPLRFLVTAGETTHTSMFEWVVAPGFTTGLHVHRVQEETFYVLAGACDWRVGDDLVHAGPGSFLFVPPGVPHAIANPGDEPARLLMTVSPPGHERYFEALGAMTAGDAKPAADQVAALRRRFDTDQVSELTVR